MQEQFITYKPLTRDQEEDHQTLTEIVDYIEERDYEGVEDLRDVARAGSDACMMQDGDLTLLPHRVNQIISDRFPEGIGALDSDITHEIARRLFLGFKTDRRTDPYN